MEGNATAQEEYKWMRCTLNKLKLFLMFPVLSPRDESIQHPNRDLEHEITNSLSKQNVSTKNQTAESTSYDCINMFHFDPSRF